MDIKEYFKQLSIVILGILIAFWVSNIGTNHNQRKAQKQVLNTIINEINENHNNTINSIKSLDKLHIIYSNIKSKNALGDTLEINYEGLSSQSVGYETAKYTNILKDIDYNITSRIVENYEKQKAIEDLENNFIDELMAFLKYKNTDSTTIDFLLVHINNLSHHLKNFDKTQNQLTQDLQVYINTKY